MVSFITPAIQEYYDPTNGVPGECYAIRPDLNQIIGRMASQHRYTRFYFPDGTVLNTVIQDDLSVTFDIAVAGTLSFSSPYGGVVWGTKDGAQNYTGLASFNPYTTPWTVVDEWGTAGAFPIVVDGVPQNIPNPISFATPDDVSLVVGSNYQGQVSWVNVADSGVSGVSNIFAPTVGTGNVYVTAGASGVAYYLFSPSSLSSGTIIIGSAEAGEFVNLASYTFTDFNPIATSFIQVTSLAYDQTDNNILSMVTTHNSDSTTTRYLCKFSSIDGSIMWQTPIETGPGDSDASVFSQTVIRSGTFYWVGYYLNSDPPGSSTNIYSIDTSTGTATIHSDTTLGSALSCEDQISNDRIGGIICNGTWNSALGTITLLNSTATSRSGCLAAVYLVDTHTNPPDHISFCDNSLRTE